jgi:hypothetical protein
MTNKTILAFAFIDACYRQDGLEFRLWHEMPDSDREQHLITAQLFIDNPKITAKQTHEAWVERRLADGWTQAEEFDLKNRLHTQLVPFEKLPPSWQQAEEAGLEAMREAFSYARDNLLPPDLEFEVMKRIAINNANFYLKVGDTLGLDLADQTSSMLLWGSLANARQHIELLKIKESFSHAHKELLENGITSLQEVAFEKQVMQPAVPGGRRDQGPFDCTEKNLEHGLLSGGAGHLNSAFAQVLSEAEHAGYCERCLIASLIGSATSALVSGARSEGMNDAMIMTVISDLIAHGFAQADAGGPLLHRGLKSEVLQ